MHYTQRLRDLREDKDLKQEEVATIIGITRQQYQLYESGKRKIPIDKLMKLCEYYNVSSDYILGYTNDPKPNWNIKNQVNISGGKNKIKFE